MQYYQTISLKVKLLTHKKQFSDNSPFFYQVGYINFILVDFGFFNDQVKGIV